MDLGAGRLTRHCRPAGGTYTEILEAADLRALPVPPVGTGTPPATLDLSALF